MSLLSDAKAAAGTEGATEVAGTKKHSNSEYQKKARAKALASAQLIKKELEAKKVTLSDEAKEALSYLCKEGRATGSAVFGQPVINKIFGNNFKVGDSVTAMKVFEETGKGFAEMRQLMKKWAEKQNIVVEYDAAKKAYTIKSIGA